MNTQLYMLTIANSFDDSTECRIIAVHKDSDINMHIAVYKANYLEEFNSERIVSVTRMQLSNKSIFVDNENEFNEVYNDLKQANLLK
jgi:hypothetical protein